MTKILIIISISLNFAYGALKPHKSKSELDGSITNLKNKIFLNREQLKEIKLQIKNVDIKITQQNKEYLKTLKIKKDIDEAISKMQLEVDDLTSLIENVKNDLRVLVEVSLLNDLTDDQDVTQLALQKELIKFLNIKVKELKSLEKSLQSNSKILSENVYKFKEKVELENNLRDSLLNLESSKSELAKNYIKVDENYRVLRRKSKTIRSSRKKHLASGIHRPPIDDFFDYEFKSKGVTFFFQNRRPVKASTSGVVNYIGEIGNYGNVVMIDHGNEIRSVYLGDFVPKLSKGQQVNRNSIIGYTRKKAEGRIYFEIRKKNKAQKTISLIDKKYLTKAN